MLPVLFCAMLLTALLLVVVPLMPKNLIVLRDDGLSVDDTMSLFPDTETSAFSQTTSCVLRTAVSDVPIETLASVRKEGEITAPPVPLREVGMRERVPAEYDYTKPVPESEEVPFSWFEDAVLVGDSRMQGLILYCGLSRLTSYTYKGLTVDTVFDRPVIEWEEAEDLPAEERIPEELWEDSRVPVMEALKQTEYNKVFIMLGINETGWSDLTWFPTAYGKFIDAIREDNPQCLIYILSVFPVTEEAEDWHPFVRNDKINQFNIYLQELAAEKQVFFVDLAPAVADENGVLPADSGVDGIHLNKTYCTQVLDYIFTHTVPLLTVDEVLAQEETAAEAE